MDDYVYYQPHAQPYPLSRDTLGLEPSDYLSSYDPNVSIGLFSEGIFPAYVRLHNDPFVVQPDLQSFHTLMINVDSDQFDPFYASLEPSNYSTPLTDDLQVYGSSSFGSKALVTEGVDTGVTFLCDQMYKPLHVSDIKTNVCEIIPAGQDGVKNDEGLSTRPKRARNRSEKRMRECDTDGSSNNSVADSLTWEILSQYFYMPIAEAARELNIGLTLFKKRCRDLGVRRWPHRKLISLQSLIKNVKEMEKDGGIDPPLSKVTVYNAIQELENQMKLMEAMPDVELEAQTKRLRQACFKANYKKRRLMIMNGGGIDNSTGSSGSNQGNGSSIVVSRVNNDDSTNGQDLQDSEELKSLLFDPPSPSECSFLNDYNM